jgi:prepilin-type N-terminal cleavage/methylation domain-containing protein
VIASLRRRLRHRARTSEQGFTLVELVVSIVILTLITGALGAAFVTAINSTKGSEQRTKSSNDAQIIAGFLTRDAQAAGGTDPATGVADPTLGVSTTDAAGCAVTGSLLMRFKWIDRSAATDIPMVASYTYAAGSQEIARTVCTNGGSPVRHVLGRNVITNGSPQSPFGWCNGDEGAACPNFPNTVTLRFTESNALNSGSAPYTYELSASLRPQSNAQPDTSPSAESAPLLLLGACPGTPGITGTGGPDLVIYGTGAVNACPSADLGGGSTAQSADGTIYVVAPGTCAEITGPCQVVTSKFSDPFAPLISSGALTAPSTAGCSGGSNPAPVAGHYSPGTFPQLLNAGSATFDPGTYVFCNGLTLNTNANVTGTGVTFYFAGGSLNVGNNASLTLSKPTSGPYANYGLTLWEASGNSGPITSENSNNIVVNIFGTLYAPSARVSFKNGTVHIDQVIALGVDLPGGGGGTTIGMNPVVTSTSPNTRGQGAVNQNITINGGNFQDGPSLASDFGPGITVNSTTFVDSTHLTANISVAGNATLGPRDVTVTNGNGKVATAANAFNVSQGPGVTAANPNSTGRGVSNQNVLITGSNFVNGAGLAASFSGTGITVNSTTWNSATQLTANINVAANAPLGSRDVTVTNPDGGRATATNAFSVVAPTIVSVALGNGPNPNVAGTIERNDTITIVFSSQMRVGDICSTWSNDAANQNLSVNGNAVNVNDGGAGNDTITVSATACTFNIGTINLGSPGFVTAGGATFGTNGNGNRSVFAWNAASHTLTIALGAKGSGTLNNVPGNVTPVYTASTIRDSGGAALTNSPFTLASSKQF